MKTKSHSLRPLFLSVLAATWLIVAFAPACLIADDGWRRTAQGWEHVSAWQIGESSTSRRRALVYRPPQVWHPAYLVAFQGGLSILALIIASPAFVRMPHPDYLTTLTNH